MRVGAHTLTNPRGAQVAALLNPAADADDPDRSPRRRRWRARVVSWVPTLGLVAASEAVSAGGHADLSWAFDGLAFAAWWLTRPLRR